LYAYHPAEGEPPAQAADYCMDFDSETNHFCEINKSRELEILGGE
jgi:hypothetical protein